MPLPLPIRIVIHRNVFVGVIVEYKTYKVLGGLLLFCVDMVRAVSLNNMNELVGPSDNLVV